MNKTLVIYKERFWESVASDLVTFSFLALCIWFSIDQGGGWWTFFTSCMFLVSVAGKMALISYRIVKIQTKAEALKWANSLTDDGGAA